MLPNIGSHMLILGPMLFQKRLCLTSFLINMLTDDRKYHFDGELILNRSWILDKQLQPKDDPVNWLFLNTGEQQFSFVYKIKNPSEAKYGKPIKADLAFTMIEDVKDIVKLDQTYEVLRGQEIIGTVKLLKPL